MFQIFRWKKRKCRGRKLRGVYLGMIPEIKALIPHPKTSDDVITLNLAEAEALRLVDYEDVSFDEAARKMRASKATVWRLTKSARRKIARALFEGKTLVLTEGGILERV